MFGWRGECPLREINRAADTAWWSLMEDGGRRNQAAFSSSPSHVQVRSHRPDTGLVLQLKAGPGTGSGGETCLWEQLGGQLLSSYGGWHVRACQLQSAILPDIRPQQQPATDAFHFHHCGQKLLQLASKKKLYGSTKRNPEGSQIHMCKCLLSKAVMFWMDLLWTIKAWRKTVKCL